MGELTFFMLRDVFTFDKIISMKSFPFTHELGWSVSRYDTFYSCKRKYYYGYYGKYDHEFEWSKISTLKSLTSVPLEIGNIAHDVMEMLLKRLVKSSDPIDKERLKTYVRNLSIEYIGKKQLQFKKSRRLKSRKNRKVSYSESDWKTYTGSCRELNEDIEKYGKENFTFEILRFCKSKWELGYEEIKLQIENEVIKNKQYYNGILNCRLGKPREYWFQNEKEG